MNENDLETGTNRAEQTDRSAGSPTAINPANVNSEQLDQLKDRAAKADEHWDRLLRTTADFDNFRKRAVREKQEAIRFANESLLTRLLPVLDSFDMALSAVQAEGSQPAVQSLQTGVSLVHQQLKNALAEAGLEEVDATGQMFDPNFHEAVSQQERADASEGQVVQQLRKGYKLRERLLRPASVVVAKSPAA